MAGAYRLPLFPLRSYKGSDLSRVNPRIRFVESPHMPETHTPSEMMIVTAARALQGVRTVFVGVGLPNSACNLARRTVAPDLELIYESGIHGARPARLPLSIGDPTLISGATSICSMVDLFGLYLQGGRCPDRPLGQPQHHRDRRQRG